MLQLVLCVGIREGTCIVRHDIQQVDFVLAMLYVWGCSSLFCLVALCVIECVCSHSWFVQGDRCGFWGLLVAFLCVCAVNLFGFFLSFYSPTLLALHQIIIRHVQSVFILLLHVQWNDSWFKMGKNALLQSFTVCIWYFFIVTKSVEIKWLYSLIVHASYYFANCLCKYLLKFDFLNMWY